MNGILHEWAAHEARNTAELAELLDRLDTGGYSIFEILATELTIRGEDESKVLYTVIAVRERGSIANPAKGRPDA